MTVVAHVSTIDSPPPADRMTAMMARYLGPAIVAALLDDDVTEVYRNSHDGAIHLDTRSRGRVDSGGRLDATRAIMFLNAAAAAAHTTLSPSSPRLETELLGAPFHGSRLQGFVPPVCSAPAFNIRKPPAMVYSLDHYVSTAGLKLDQRAAIADAVITRRNVLIAGGTNSGKTTLANAVLREIAERCPAERVVILEDTIELQCLAPDHLALRTGADVTLADLVRSTMRTSPDRIVVGEVRGAEALDLLDAWATGHPGGIATVHASSAEGALVRLDRLARRANVPSQRELIAEAIHLIVVMNGRGRQRRATEVARVVGLDDGGRFLLQQLTSTGEWI
ncbi:MAG: P-type conjugative transfer ATPase TrbB [bacterium]